MASCWQSQPPLPGSQWSQQQQQQPFWQPQTFRDLMHAFPRPRRTGRVTKPRSAGNSPSSAGRRRTATTATMPQSSPMYHHPRQAQNYQPQFNAALLDPSFRRGGGNARPMSWHPASFESSYFPNSTTTPDNFAPLGLGAQPMNSSTPTTFENAPMLPSYALAGPPTSSETFSMPTMQAPAPAPAPAPMDESSFLQMTTSQPEPTTTWDCGASNLSAVAHPVPDYWSLDVMSMNNSVPSAGVAGSSYASVPSSGYLTSPSTPDFLPIQQPDDNSPVLDKPNQEDELVGMGLYNNPDALLDSSLNGGLSGKGLKLEETFTPSSDSESDDNDADAEDDDDDDESQSESESCSSSSFNASQAPKQLNPQQQQQPYNQQPVKPFENMAQRSFFFEDDDDMAQPPMAAGAQPLLNMGGQPCMNYGYGGWF